jgi:hypothetical protein
MNQTRLLRTFPKKKKYFWQVRRNSEQYRFPSQLIGAGVASAKQISIQGQRLSGRDFVQSTWGRVQTIAGNEYARVLLDSGTVQQDLLDGPITSSDVMVVSCYGPQHSRHEPSISREKLASALTESLAEFIFTFDDKVIRAFVSKLSEMPDNHARLHAVRAWFDDIESSESTTGSSQSQQYSKSTVLEELEGFVDQIEGSIAYVRLKSQHGDELYGEYPAADLLAQGIKERRRFRCVTIQRNGDVHVTLEAIPEQISDAAEENLHQRIEKLVADDQLNGDY